MEHPDYEYLATLRAVVGYLGEKNQAGWWPSSFFATGSTAFLAPVFPRTQVVAQCAGVVNAASRVHDERIGVGQVYHLFRLPEDLEQSIHRVMHAEETATCIKNHVATPDAAMKFLREGNGSAPGEAIGPTRVADVAGLRVITMWHKVAAAYASGFEKQTEIYPYFTDRK